MLTLARIEEAVHDAASSLDISKIYLFGSYARGTANDQSDVDLCLETGATFSLFNAGAFSHTLASALGAPIDITTETSLYGFVKEGCLKERILIYERI